jgi:hypothetical protein
MLCLASIAPPYNPIYAERLSIARFPSKGNWGMSMTLKEKVRQSGDVVALTILTFGAMLMFGLLIMAKFD